ncbi:hypothetical protein [Algoriphagus terrigena]|uniref:hypothetical protein n=1 Tax=Algoriphagus terrigena TaxID=344884 RepID=UPI001FDEBC80|nr:hypothetical protein [Algoriphagus terrigena]
MANRALTMNKMRQILRGHFEGRGTKLLRQFFEHKPDDKVFIEYVGKPLYITDPKTGQHIPVQVFFGGAGSRI